MSNLLRAPFFIVANPRSGSSLLRIICDSNPNLIVPPECGFIEWWYDKYKNWKIDCCNDEIELNAFLIDLKSSKKIETWNINYTKLKKEIKKQKPKNYQELTGLVYCFFGTQNSKNTKVWGDKNNYYIDKLEVLNKIFNKAKFIHLVRDGRDVATSYLNLKNLKSTSKYFPNLPHKIGDISNEWNINNLKVEHFKKSLNSNQYLLVKYEDLILETEQTSITICNFLNVEYNPSMLNYYKRNALETTEPKETLDWKKNTLKKPIALNIGKYKNLLSAESIELFNTIAAQSLTNYGYDNE